MDYIWKEELNKSIRTLEELKEQIQLTEGEEAAFEDDLNIPFRITPHIVNLIKSNDLDGRIRKQFIPSKSEVADGIYFKDDYLEEEKNEVAKNLIRRYPYKAILLTTDECSAYCRFCTRKRTVGIKEKEKDLTDAFLYLESHPEIYDIVLTGGDPLTLDDIKLEYILSRLTRIHSIKIIRLNTRIPVTIPSRITNHLVNLLKKYNVNYINIHFEHPNELTFETKRACSKLSNNGIILGSQSVLLKDINNDEKILESLFLQLLINKIRPYYLYQCDKVNGCQQFYVNPIEGMQLLNRIVKNVPGLCVPRFVIDVPGKIGKTTIGPNGIEKIDDNTILLKDYQTKNVFYYDL